MKHEAGGRSLRARSVVAGIGCSPFYKHGKSPDSEFKLALLAILDACRDAGIDAHDIDGFTSFGNDRNDPVRLANALGIRELRFSCMQWRGGGGGVAAAVANGAAAIATGQADCIVVHRALAQGAFRRFGLGTDSETVTGEDALEVPYGLLNYAHKAALRCRRFMHEHNVAQSALRAIALASYTHAQANPHALMRGRPLDQAAYDDSRWIVEPFHLFDCCMENDAAAAIVLVPADRARDLPHRPAYVLAAAGGAGTRAASAGFNAPDYAGAGQRCVAPRVYAAAGLRPQDVDVVQAYENFTGGVLMSLAEHGFFAADEANEFLVLDNLLAPDGKLPLNTSGGNLAECYVHGMSQVVEAVRQIRRSSTSPARRADISMMIGGPMVAPTSSLILGSADTV